jgi:hypothetical protein
MKQKRRQQPSVLYLSGLAVGLFANGLAFAQDRELPPYSSGHPEDEYIRTLRLIWAKMIVIRVFRCQ